jgi:hypothetical protein
MYSIQPFFEKYAYMFSAMQLTMYLVQPFFLRWNTVIPISFARQDRQAWPWLHPLDSYDATHCGNPTAQPAPIATRIWVGLLR